MIYKKEEWESIPFSEKWKLEKSKLQQSPIFWINEYISSHVSSAEDVIELVQYAKNVTEQLESLYGNLEGILLKYQVSDLEELSGYVENLKEQVESLYAEKEEVLKAFPGVGSTSDLQELALGMEAQLKDLYSEKDKVGEN